MIQPGGAIAPVSENVSEAAGAAPAAAITSKAAKDTRTLL
jgi:hypothetical protein